MQPQNWRSRDDRSSSNASYDRDQQYQGGHREPSRMDRDAEMEGRWAERNLDDDQGTRRGGNDMTERGGYYTDAQRSGRGDSGTRGGQGWQSQSSSFGGRGGYSQNDYSMRASRGYDEATVHGGYGYGSGLQHSRETSERFGPSFDERGHMQGRHMQSGRYDERGYVSGDESSLKYSDRNYGPGNNSIYDRGTEMTGGQRPFMGKGPKGYTRSDERIREEVCECLSEGHIDASDIDVMVQNGEVTLSGTVMDRRSKRMAEEMIDHVSGVKDVENKLKVKAEGSRGKSEAGEDSSDKDKMSTETSRTPHSKRVTA